MARTIEELELLFDDHPSLDASLRDFEANSDMGLSPRILSSLSPNLPYPSHHSGFRSDTSSELADSLGGYSPPAWRRDENGHRSSGFWSSAKQGHLLSRSSRETSPGDDSDSDDERCDDTLAAAARTRLPTGSLSPEKRRSPSPEPYPAGNADFAHVFGGGAVKKEDAEEQTVVQPSPENSNNCMVQTTS